MQRANRVKLTDRKLKSLKRSPTRQVDHWDKEIMIGAAATGHSISADGVRKGIDSARAALGLPKRSRGRPPRSR